MKKIKKGISFVFVIIIILGYLWYCQDNKKVKNAMEQNENYAGIGQEKVRGEGYTTTFTTTEKKVYKEYKQNGNSPWSKRYYWGGTMEENGCGITCLAILASGYGKNITPEDLRKRYVTEENEHLDGDKIGEALADYLQIENTDFYYREQYFEKEYVINWLEQEKPILICVWDRPNSKWTTSSHYMVLLATDGINHIYVSNPNGADGTEKMSGWYETEEILPYIVKALYITSK